MITRVISIFVDLRRRRKQLSLILMHVIRMWWDEMGQDRAWVDRWVCCQDYALLVLWRLFLLTRLLLFRLGSTLWRCPTWWPFTLLRLCLKQTLVLSIAVLVSVRRCCVQILAIKAAFRSGQIVLGLEKSYFLLRLLPGMVILVYTGGHLLLGLRGRWRESPSWLSALLLKSGKA